MSAGVLLTDPAVVAAHATSPPSTPSERIFTLPVERASTTARLESLDAARLIAVFCIILLHAAESRQLVRIDLLGTFGVPFYLFASLYFQARSFKRDPKRLIHEYAVARLRRLYVPFLGWTLIYLLARNLKHLLLTHDGPVAARSYFLWTGSAHHLWFLPLLMVVSLLGAILCRWCANDRVKRGRAIVIFAILGTVLAVIPRPDWLNHLGPNNEEGVFFLQCWKALPSVFLGLALAWWLAWERHDRLLPPAVGFAGVLLTLATVGNQLVHGYQRLDRTLSGLGWLMAALTSWQGAWVSCFARLGRYAYGIYLVHVLFTEGIQTLARYYHVSPSTGLDVFTIAVAFVGSSFIAVALARSKHFAWLSGD